MRQIQGDLFLSPGPTARVDERDHMEIKVNKKKMFLSLSHNNNNTIPPFNNSMPPNWVIPPLIANCHAFLQHKSFIILAWVLMK